MFLVLIENKMKTLQKTQTLAELIRELDDKKNSRVIIHKDELAPFLFEYACQTIEYDGLNAKDLSSEIEGIMYCKLERMVETHMEEHYLERRMPLIVPPMHNIQLEVKKDKATPFNPYKNESRIKH